MLYEALIAVISKNAIAFLSKTGDKGWDYKKLLEDVVYGVIVAVIIYIASFFGASLTEQAAVNTLAYAFAIYAVDRIIHIFNKLFIEKDPKFRLLKG